MTSKVAVAMLFARGSRLSEGVRKKADIEHAEDEPEMPQHHGSTENHGCWVGLIRAHDIAGNVATSRLEEGILLRRVEPGAGPNGVDAYPSNITSGNNTGSAYQGSSDIRNDGPVQVGHYHYIELTRLCHELHRPVS